MAPSVDRHDLRWASIDVDENADRLRPRIELHAGLQHDSSRSHGLPLLGSQKHSTNESLLESAPPDARPTREVSR